MCRFLACKGPPVTLHHLVYELSHNTILTIDADNHVRTEEITKGAAA